MKEEYIPALLARELIDKGCPVSIVVKYDGERPSFFEYPIDHPDWPFCRSWYLPTIEQVLRWFRKDTPYYIQVVFDALNGWFYFEVINLLTRDINRGDGKPYDTYETCAIAGIEYTLQFL